MEIYYSHWDGLALVSSGARGNKHLFLVLVEEAHQRVQDVLDLSDEFTDLLRELFATVVLIAAEAEVS